MKKNYDNKNLQLFYGLMIGIAFGFLLQKGGVTKYDVIVGQLRLIDFTVVQIIITAIIVTMLGISFFYPRGIIEVKTKAGSIKNSVIGGLIFGVGFGLLGYCPGTIAGAIGNGYLDAMTGGLLGIIFGSALFAFMYPELKEKKILTEDKFSKVSYFDKVKDTPFKITIPFSLILLVVLFLIEM
jgi:hypothetical protein